MSINEVVICGRLTRDCEVKTTPNGTGVVNFTIASDEWRKEGEKYEKYTNFIPCVYFNAGISNYLKKGTKVTVEGNLHYSTWESKDGKRSKIEIKVRQVELPPKQEAFSTETQAVYLEDCPF